MSAVQPSGVYSPFEDDDTLSPTLDEHLAQLQAAHGVDGDTALRIAWEQAPTPPAA
jgi:hypothetical protein